MAKACACLCRQCFLLTASVNSVVMVRDASGAGKHHFRDLQTTANDLRKAEKT